jgi:hypothetical protein
MAITGGCLCGAVTYTCEGEPAFSGLCHCRNCQRYTGSSFEAVAVYPSPQVAIHGRLTTYKDRGDSGRPVFRNFCPDCGSGIFATAEVWPGLTIVLAGTLDDPEKFRPTMEIYCCRVQPWMRASANRIQHAKMPT